jgi:hypothetical protein
VPLMLRSQRPYMTPATGQGRADDEGEGDNLVDVDAHQRRDLLSSATALMETPIFVRCTNK